MEVGKWKLEVGNWKLEVGNWKLEVGSWKLEVGSWKLESGGGGGESATTRGERMAIQSFRDLHCYQNALKAIPRTEEVTEKFIRPKDAKLASQIRNAAHSVTSNIAEGFGHLEKEVAFKGYMRIAMGSANEVIARLDSAHASRYIDSKTLDELTAPWTVVGKQLNKLIQNWKRFD